MTKTPTIFDPMTPEEFREAQDALGLSDRQAAELFGYTDRVTIRRYKMGDDASQRRRIPRLAALLLRLLVRIPEARRLVGIEKRKEGT